MHGKRRRFFGLRGRQWRSDLQHKVIAIDTNLNSDGSRIKNYLGYAYR